MTNGGPHAGKFSVKYKDDPGRTLFCVRVMEMTSTGFCWGSRSVIPLEVTMTVAVLYPPEPDFLFCCFQYYYPLPQRELVLLCPVLGPPDTEYLSPQRQLVLVCPYRDYNHMIIICVTAVLYWCALIETTIISPSIYITQSYHYLIRA